MKCIVLKAADAQVVETGWGSLTWHASKALGNSESLTVGRCILKPGCGNPEHLHPNCDEVLHVLQGTILHGTGGGEMVRMEPGDTISVPAHAPHSAQNVGDGDAVLMICYSSARRETVNE